MLRKITVIMLVAVFLTVAAACGLVGQNNEKAIVEYGEGVRPAPTGPYAVGQTELILKDSSRSIRYTYDEAKQTNEIVAISSLGTYHQMYDPTRSVLKNPPTEVFFAPPTPDPYSWEMTEETQIDGENLRELRVVVQYPTDRVNYTQAQPLFSDFLISEVQNRENGLDLLAEAEAYVVPDAPMLEGKGKLPVVFFCSGLGLETEFYQTYAEELASHGYVVVNINAPFWGGAHENYAKEGKEPDFRPQSARGAMMNGMYNELTPYTFFDVPFVLDSLQQNSDFADADFEQVYFFGHSYGAEMGSGAMVLDDRVQALCLVDGILYPEYKETQARASRPIFALSSSGYGMTPEVFEPYRESDGSSVTYLYFPDANHMSFAAYEMYASGTGEEEDVGINQDTLISSRKAILAFFDAVRNDTYDKFPAYLNETFQDNISGNNAQLLIDFSIR